MAACAFGLGNRLGRLGFLLAGMVFGLAFAAEPASGGQLSAKLMELRVVGSERYPQKDIIAATGLKLGTTVSPADFTAAAQRLADIGAFSSVRYRYQPLGAGVSVQFEVVDAEKLLPCRFANFVWFSQEDLIVALRSRVPLFSGEAAPGRSQLEQIRSALEAILKERGIGGHVTFEMEGNAAGKGGRVVFAVEGIPIFVREVELPGANAINRETLARLTGAVVGGNYDPALIGTFLVANLKLEYGDRGYLKATLEAPTAELIKHDGPETWVKLILPVKEGPQYRLAAIHWTGNNVFTEPDLAKRFGLKPGDIANQGLFEKGEATVQRLYATRGYARARLEALPTFDDDQHTVGYEMRIEQGSLYRMGRLTITGLDAPTTARLENVCRLAPGQVYDRDYWAVYMKSIAGLLPPDYRQARPALKEDIDDAAKTVNVTFEFAPESTP